MTCDDAMTRTALPPAWAVVRLVAGLLAMLFAQVLPTLVRRPDLRAPVLRAALGLSAAAWRHARTPGGDARGLRAAALALAAALQAVVDAAAVEGPPVPRPREAGDPALRCGARPARPAPRARDGPARTPLPAA